MKHEESIELIKSMFACVAANEEGSKPQLLMVSCKRKEDLTGKERTVMFLGMEGEERFIPVCEVMDPGVIVAEYDFGDLQGGIMVSGNDFSPNGK